MQFGLITFALGLCLQGSAAGLKGTDCMLAAEQKRLSTTEKIDGRINVYRDVSTRLNQATMAAVRKQDYEESRSRIQCWADLLTASLKDIEANINRKKKSGALIRYEIQLRKSIVDVTDMRMKAPYEQQAAFETWLKQAETTREKFVDILFQR